MAKIENVQVYGLEESIYRSGYPMMAVAPTSEEFAENVAQIRQDIAEGGDSPHISRAVKLATMAGGGHDQFLTGILVNFDLTFTNKAWVEAERYTFLNFISSCSTMHKISTMNIADCCNEYVSVNSIMEAEEWQKNYHVVKDSEDTSGHDKKDLYLYLLYNLPSGFEITAGMTTNYRALKNIYHQRRNHRLPDWQVFCDWVETLPLSELITGEVK